MTAQASRGRRRGSPRSLGAALLLATIVARRRRSPPPRERRHRVADHRRHLPLQPTARSTRPRPPPARPTPPSATRRRTDPDRATVWYSFTPDADGDYLADTFGSDYDTTLYVGTPDGAGGIDVIGCIDDNVEPPVGRDLGRHRRHDLPDRRRHVLRRRGRRRERRRRRDARVPRRRRPAADRLRLLAGVHGARCRRYGTVTVRGTVTCENARLRRYRHRHRAGPRPVHPPRLRVRRTGLRRQQPFEVELASDDGRFRGGRVTRVRVRGRVLAVRVRRGLRGGADPAPPLTAPRVNGWEAGPRWARLLRVYGLQGVRSAAVLRLRAGRRLSRPVVARSLAPGPLPVVVLVDRPRRVCGPSAGRHRPAPRPRHRARSRRCARLPDHARVRPLAEGTTAVRQGPPRAVTLVSSAVSGDPGAPGRRPGRAGSERDTVARGPVAQR